MPSSRWATIAIPIIERIVKEHGGHDTPELRKALRDAYPFGERRYWPYKVWCRLVSKELGIVKRGSAKQLPLFDGIEE